MDNLISNNEIIKPWYKQFWPWFIIFFPASAVIAGTITVFIAFDNADSLVYDDYYNEGLAINAQIQKQKQAATLGYSALLKRMPDNRLYLKFDNASPKVEFLTLAWVHPADSKKDFTVDLHLQLDGSYQTKSEQLITGRWYLRLFEDDKWMIKSEISKDLNSVHLAPNLY